MFRHSFFMFLRAFMVCVLTASLPGPALGQDEGDAMIILYNTEKLTEALKHRQLSQIIGRGPMLADWSGNPSESEEKGPMLAEGPQHGPRVDPGEGPEIAPSVPMGETRKADGADIYHNIPADQETLYQEIRALRQDVDRLRHEAEARESLRITEDEVRDEESEILEAAGREYSLMRAGMLSMGLSVNYTYNSYDVIRDLYRQEGTQLEYHTAHTISSGFSLEVPRRDNLTISASIPFVYKYDNVGTERSQEVNDLGDISLGAKYQPFKRIKAWPSPIVSFGYTFPTGRGALDIDPNRELSTGSGLHSISTGVSVSQPFDPVNAFASLSYSYSFSRDNIRQRLARGMLMEVKPGDGIGGSIGFGYALSYRMSLSLGLSYSYQFSTSYHWDDGSETKTGDRIGSSLSLNTSWRVTPARSLIVGVSKGLTRDSSDFSLSMRLPIEFDLR